MDDWKLKARVVVKLKREANMLVSFYTVDSFPAAMLILLIIIIIHTASHSS